MKKYIQRIAIVFVLTSASYVHAQVISNQPINSGITGQNPFFDAATNFSDANSIGKGLAFPRTDLTIWTFITDALDGLNFPTGFDGMLVYNTGTGSTITGQGLVTQVTPGFYYFSNPTGVDDVANGKWYPVAGLPSSVRILKQIGIEADSPNTIPSSVTASQIASIPGVLGVIGANLPAYQAYIDANPNLFAAPATVAEINAMIIAVNSGIIAVLVQIGNEGDAPNVVPSVVSTTQLASLPGVTGVVPANQSAYQAYIDANPNAFAAPATVAEVQVMITAVNAAQSVLVQVGNEGDSPNVVPSVVTTTQLASLPGITGAVPTNQAAYQAYIDANPNSFAAPATIAEVQVMITAVNVLVQIGNEGDAPNVVPSVVTTTQLASVPGLTGIVPANQAAYQAYIDANPNAFAAPATIAEVQVMITAVNVLVQIGKEGDNPNIVPSVVTTTQLASVPGVTGVVTANQVAYQAYIDANPNSFSATATVAQVNTMITAVNTAQSVLVQVGNEGDAPNIIPSVVTTTQLASVPGVTGVLTANQAGYRAYIDANPNAFSAPATVAEINAMIIVVNSQAVLIQVGNEGDSPNIVPSVVTTAQLASVPGVTGVVNTNRDLYRAYIDANPNLFAAPATVSEVNAMITAVNSAVNAILIQVGNEGDFPNIVPSVVTTAQLAYLPNITGIVPANQSAYQAYIDAFPNSFSAPATVTQLKQHDCRGEYRAISTNSDR